MTDQQPAPAADAEPDPPSWRSTVWLFLKYVALQVLIFFVLYTLSIGPMFWKWYGGQYLEADSPVAVFYEPLHLLAEWCDPFGKFMNWYVDLWIG
jgi:hypothetical protein